MSEATPEGAGLPYYEACFICGQANPHGLKLRFWREGDGVRATFRPTAPHSGFKDLVHGGIAASLLDEAMEWAIAVREGRFGPLAALSVRYRAPMTLDREYQVQGWVAGRRRNLAETRGEIRDVRGKLHAEATGRYLLSSAEASRAFARHLTYREEDAPLFGDRG